MVRLTFCALFLTTGTLASVFSTEQTGSSKDARYLFYVAPTGNDQWSGELAAANPAGDDGPFATLTRARDAIRQLKYHNQGQLDRPVEVLVRGGNYHLTEPLRLSAGDSGTKRYPVRYQAYPVTSPTKAAACCRKT